LIQGEIEKPKKAQKSKYLENHYLHLLLSLPGGPRESSGFKMYGKPLRTLDSGRKWKNAKNAEIKIPWKSLPTLASEPPMRSTGILRIQNA
jgi:hypothetical protein